ncbi:C-4 sterol methyl oxidase [Steccherinum ochraceum]|uniref:C-4 sterol methyl oxidase n=1 Tax=Steccherinum ochraceum TaxID=92696 RepID=A0A4R0RKQ4_9APHY|nr:C-4 sterol methyl oxidase [Steccherinum ochraceum]
MSNSTATPYVSAAMLYANTDFTKLTWFELQWVGFYLWIDNPSVATGLMSFLLHELVYFGRCIPFLIMDEIPYFHKWKLQPDKAPTRQEKWECTKHVLFSHFTIEGPAIWLFHPTAEMVGLTTWQVPLPSWSTVLPQVFLFMVFEDMFHYCAHRFLHWGPMYKNVHKIHHKYSAPFGLAAEYAHPAEVFILGLGTIAGPFLYCAITGELHIFSMYVWIFCRLLQAIDSHSGYDFPWSLRHFVPFWSGAEHHDFHHMAFVNNFSTSFRWCDYLLGTDDKYREYRAKIDAAKKTGMTRSQLAEYEKKIAEEAEKEGARAEKEVEEYTFSGKPKAVAAQ